MNGTGFSFFTEVVIRGACLIWVVALAHCLFDAVAHSAFDREIDDPHTNGVADRQKQQATESVSIDCCHGAQL
jgi:hypothetical protein